MDEESLVGIEKLGSGLKQQSMLQVGYGGRIHITFPLFLLESSAPLWLDVGMQA
ncbi:MAG TPA: hypothetical protein VMS31_15305 [Pyrinomonadaceae bacterium]|nr:hypothetical protein [Pyrinomonadaceae bacterium]